MTKTPEEMFATVSSGIALDDIKAGLTKPRDLDSFYEVAKPHAIATERIYKVYKREFQQLFKHPYFKEQRKKMQETEKLKQETEKLKEDENLTVDSVEKIQHDLHEFSKSKLIMIFRSLNQGRLGFDGARRSKQWIIEKITKSFDLDAVQAVIRAGVKANGQDIPLPSGIMGLRESLFDLLGDQAMSRDEIQSMITATIHTQHKPKISIEIATENGKRELEQDHYHEAFPHVLKLAVARVNILLIGPAGSGKTHMAEQIATALKLPFHSISITAGISESQLLGALLPTGNDGAFVYTPTSFINCYENGGVFLLDELDSADPNTVLSINKALAGNSFHLPSRFGNELVKRSPDFIAVGAVNTMLHGADNSYSGRERQDGALVDRFRSGRVKIDYDERLEAQLVHPDILSWAKPIRRKIKEKNLHHRVLSTRLMVDFTRLLEISKLTKPIWEYSYFLDWSDDELNQIGYARPSEGVILK